MTIALCAFYGALIGGGKRFVQVDVFAGLGLVTGVFTVLGVVLSAPFGWLVFAFWGGGLVAIVFVLKREESTKGVLWRIFVLGIPLLLLVSAMTATQWDEFSQWLPNAAFLYKYDDFPGLGFPRSPSIFPAYPYAGPLVTYLVSRLTGVFVENAGGIANVVLLFCFAPVYLSVVKRGLAADIGWSKTWGAAALGILGVTVLSTAFVQKLVFTAYGDVPTGIVLAVLGILVWKILGGLAEGKQDFAALAWQFSFTAALFVNLRQPNLVLLTLLLLLSAVVAWRDPAIRVRRYLALWLRMLVAPAVVYLMWRFHVGRNLAAGEFLFLPFGDWHVVETFDILIRMASIALRKGGYFAMMIGLVFFAGLAVLRCRSAFDRLVLLTGGLFVGYNLFLFAMYIVAFDTGSSLRAAGFWRFNTHLGLLGSTTAALGLAILWRKYGVDEKARRLSGGRSVLAAAAILLVLAVPVVTASKLRFDIRPQKAHMRMVAQDLADILPEKANLAVVDPEGEGLSSVIMAFELLSAPGVTKPLRVTRQYKVRNKPRNRIAAEVAAKGITHAWVHQVLPGVNSSLGLNLGLRQSHLLKWNGAGWRLVKSWPYQGYDDPRTLPD
ncbi:MAG: hypothetical protein ISR51_01265 [Rhodospirillales bacterium]|nr:hypothetical protein [Alphaproteobacteria bacterium]MBL6947279.1 hypothetical protein [Rhodospirillales bacterium]